MISRRFLTRTAFAMALTTMSGACVLPAAAQTEQDTSAPASVLETYTPSDTGYDPVKTPSPLTPQELDLLAVGIVKEVTRTGAILLENGESYALDQVRVPLAIQSAVFERLNKRLAGTKIGLYGYRQIKFGKADRYGNIYAHVVTENGEWIQADMVSSGLAWVDGDEFRYFLVNALYTLEDTAITRKLGFWQSPKYTVKTYDTIAPYSNSYQVYEGNYTASTRIRETGDTYIKLDDGEIELLIDKKHAQSLIQRDPKFQHPPGTRYGGKRLRVRGWVEKDARGKLVIKITHPEQIILVSKAL